MKHFKMMLRKADNTYVRELVIGKEAVEALRPQLQGLLGEVAERLREEASSKGQTASGLEEEDLIPVIRMQAEQSLRARLNMGCN